MCPPSVHLLPNMQATIWMGLQARANATDQNLHLKSIGERERKQLDQTTHEQLLRYMGLRSVYRH